jgi:endonuclease YncB( thermonuclease family)
MNSLLAKTPCIALIVLATAQFAALAADLIGQATVIDGDTLEIHGARIRMWGIDASESSQLCRGDDSLQYQCGAKAANEPAALIGGRSVSCKPVTKDRYGRTVASCAVGGADVADWVVRQELALDWPHYSNGRYFRAQDEARHGERGIWAGSYGRSCNAPAAVSWLRTCPPVADQPTTDERFA